MRLALAAATLVLLAAAPASAGRRTLLAVGSNLGLAHETPLRHAASDARRVADLFRSMGGVDAADVALLTDPSGAALFSAIRGLARADADTLFFYFSGHGDDASVHLAGERVELARIEAALAELGVRLRVLVLDACRSVDQSKGLRRITSFSVDLTASESHHEGVVALRASSLGEAAHESKELGGGVFTHFFLSGLRGSADDNRDGRVTLAEAYEFAHGRTHARSVATAGAPQRPELATDLRGNGPLVVTQLLPALSRLVLPAGADVSYFIYEKGSSAVLSSAAGAAVGPTVALPSGRFVVVRQGAGGAGAAEVVVPAGGEQRLAASAFVPVPPDRLFGRGGQLEIHDHAVTAAAGIALHPAAAGPALGARYGQSLGAWQAEAGLEWGSLQYLAQRKQIARTRLELHAGVGPRWAGTRFDLYALGELCARVERQAETISRFGTDTVVHSQALGPGLGARAGASWPLAPRLRLVAELGVRGFVYRARGDRGRAWTAEPIVAARLGATTAF